MVEETLNALLDAEVGSVMRSATSAVRHAGWDIRAGHDERKLQTKTGEVRLKVPKLRRQTFETAIIERYRPRESSVEEALIEMYLARGIGAPGRGYHGGPMRYADVARATQF
jgi:transposase-like protein